MAGRVPVSHGAPVAVADIVARSVAWHPEPLSTPGGCVAPSPSGSSAEQGKAHWHVFIGK